MKSMYVCQECGYKTTKWLGKCPECGKWNSLIEEVIEKNNKQRLNSFDKLDVYKIDNITVDIQEDRFSSGFLELDRVLGGGFVKGSLVLIGGEPGIGKSTLLLQVASILANNKDVLYISGEEGINQLRLRAKRLNASEKINVLTETNFDIIEQYLEAKKPEFIIIDSIQTMFSSDFSSAPGSVSQVREITLRLMRIAKKYNITTVIVGHVTKDGLIAGPRVLEHMVDCVLYFEGERFNTFRIIRAYKNRFGPTNELGIFEMSDNGLLEIDDASRLFLDDNINSEGRAIFVGIEGTRPLVLEIQALTSTTQFGTPRRTVTGVDYNRCMMLCAVLEKKIGIPLGLQDIYINVIGGFKISETAADLAIISSIASSYKNIPIGNIVLIGEVGLGGEIRGVSNVQRRINEAKKLGFETVIIPKKNIDSIKDTYNIQIIGMNYVSEVLNYIF
ncbi:DNA repair protein RadA [Caldicellulosiruptoraceae bacterium PP1]